MSIPCFPKDERGETGLLNRLAPIRFDPYILEEIPQICLHLPVLLSV